MSPASIQMYGGRKKPENTSSESAQSDIDIQLKIWPNFKEEFDTFDRILYEISKRKNERIYTQPENLNQVTKTGSENNVLQQHFFCLNLVFQKIYPSKSI